MAQYVKLSGQESLQGQVAVVTGAANGIGAATAEYLAAKGADIVLVDVLDKVSAAADQIRQAHGVRALGVCCDLTKSAEIRRAVQEALNAFGTIDILCNIAGVAELAPAEELSEAYWDRVMDINAKAVFMMSQQVGRVMIEKRRGKIVNMASQAGIIALDKHVAYTASKAAVIGITKVLALEWAQYNINVNAVSPTVVLTELGEKAWHGQVGEDMKKQIPCGRFAYPDEIAAAVYFLCSDGANMITGENLVVDGGYTIK